MTVSAGDLSNPDPSPSGFVPPPRPEVPPHAPERTGLSNDLQSGLTQAAAFACAGLVLSLILAGILPAVWGEDVGDLLGVWQHLGLGVQIWALSLGGSVTVSGSVPMFGSVSLSIAFVPWLVTASAVTASVLVGRLVERRAPARGTRTLWGRIAVAAVAPAIFATLLAGLTAFDVPLTDAGESGAWVGDEGAAALHVSALGPRVAIFGLLIGGIAAVWARVVAYPRGRRLAALGIRTPSALAGWGARFAPTLWAGAVHATIAGALLVLVLLVSALSSGAPVSGLFTVWLLLTGQLVVDGVAVSHLGGLRLAISADGNGALGALGNLLNGAGPGHMTLGLATPDVPGYAWLSLLIAGVAVVAAGLSLGLRRLPTEAAKWSAAWQTPVLFGVAWLILAPLTAGTASGRLVAKGVAGWFLGGSGSGQSAQLDVALTGWTFLVMLGWGILVEVVARLLTPWAWRTAPGLCSVLVRGHVAEGWNTAAQPAPVLPAPVRQASDLQSAPTTGTVPPDGPADSAGAGPDGILASSDPAPSSPVQPALTAEAPAPQPGPATAPLPTASLAPPLPEAAQAGAPAPTAPRPTSRRTRWVAGVVVAGVVVLAVGLPITRNIVNDTTFGPQHLVQDYLDALARGDGERVLSLAPLSGRELDRTLLTEKAIGRATGHISDQSVVRVGAVHSGRVGVDVRYAVHGTVVRQTLTAVRDGHTGVVFDRWRLAPFTAAGEGGTNALSTVAFAAPGFAHVSVGGTVANAQDPGGEFALPAFPGTYRVGVAANGYLEAKPVTVSTGTPGAESTDRPELRGTPSQKLVQSVSTLVNQYLSSCLASARTDPDGGSCPVTATEPDGSVSAGAWFLGAYPHVTFDGAPDTSGTESDDQDGQSWSFKAADGRAVYSAYWTPWASSDPNNVQHAVQQSNISLTGRVSLERGVPVVTVGSNGWFSSATVLTGTDGSFAESHLPSPLFAGTVDDVAAPKFVSKTGNISCAIDSQVRCVIQDHQFSGPENGNQFTLTHDGPAVIGQGGQAVASGPDGVLIPDTSSTVNGFRCVADLSGMRCGDLNSRHGFAVAQEGYLVY